MGRVQVEMETHVSGVGYFPPLTTHTGLNVHVRLCVHETGVSCVRFGKRRTSASPFRDESPSALVSSDERKRTAETKVQMKGNRARGVAPGGPGAGLDDFTPLCSPVRRRDVSACQLQLIG